MISIAKQHMIPALKSLWIEAFGDSESYVDFFFENRFDADTTFVYLVEGEPVSMAFVLEAELYHNGSYTLAGYVYAVATGKEFQGRGFSTEILEQIKKRYPTTFLVPATESLFDFYGRKGYRNAFSLSRFTYELDKEATVTHHFSLEAVSPQEYKEIRDAHFQREGYIRWDTKGIVYALKENSFSGGWAVKIISPAENTTEGILLYRCYENELYVKETTLSGQLLNDVVNRLMDQHHATVAHIRLSTWDASGNFPDPLNIYQTFGMLCSSVSIEEGYCNLVLD